MDLLKENGLLSFWWEFPLKGFLDKTGRGWSRDAVKTIFKMKLKDFLVMIGLKLLITGYLENTLRYTTPFNNSENSVMAQVLIYLSKECHHQHFGKLHPTIEDRQFQAMHFLRELRDNIKRIWPSCLIFATSVDGLAY